MRIIAVVASVALAGCATPNASMPLMFGESITFGVSIGSSTAEQGVDLTLGFKSRDIALVPVVGPNGASIESAVVDANGKATDAYSVLGQFDSKTDGTGAKVGLGKFFATGTAAATLADGFAKSMNGGGDTTSPQTKANAQKTGAKKNP